MYLKTWEIIIGGGCGVHLVHEEQNVLYYHYNTATSATTLVTLRNNFLWDRKLQYSIHCKCLNCVIYRDCKRITLVILTQRPWLLRYSSPVVRIHVPFFSSMLYLHNFLMWGVWRGLSKTGMSVLEPPAGTPEEVEEVKDESLQTL